MHASQILLAIRSITVCLRESIITKRNFLVFKITGCGWTLSQILLIVESPLYEKKVSSLKHSNIFDLKSNLYRICLKRT